MAKYAVEPEVLIWAREECELSLPQAAEKLRRFLGDNPEARLKAIENSDEQPSLTILQAMSRTYKVSLITLCLPTPPPRSEIPKDFRTLRGQSPTISTETILAIRTTQRQQEAIAELVKDIPHLYRPVVLPRITLKNRFEVVAATERQRLGVTLQMQHDWEDSYEAFNAWRWFVEQLGILVFSFHMPINDCRGFVLSGEANIPAIVVNAEDSDEAQIFTLFHEYAHILLRQFGICGRTENVDERRLERFSNNFAANLLMPHDKVVELAELSSLDENADFDIMLDAARTIGKNLHVSVEAAILRLEQVGKAPEGSHDEYLVYARRRKIKPKRRGGIAPYHRRHFNKLGSRYISIVLEALNENYIDAAEANDMLDGVRARHFLGLESDLAERMKQYGTIAKS